MRTFVLSLIALCILIAPSHALAEKIGVINVDYILKNCEPGEAALNQLKDKTMGMKKSFEAEKAKLEAMREELQKQSLVLSQEAKQDKELEFRRSVRDFQDNYQAMQRKLKTEEEALSKPIIEMIIESVKDYGKEKKFTAIWDSRNSGMIYADPSTDITQEIIVDINKRWREKQGK